MLFRRVIAFPGVGGDELTGVRRMVRRASELLGDTWVVGDDEQADLVVADLDVTEGMIAQARAIERKRLWVAIDADPDEHGMLLARPFELDGLMQLLVGASQHLPKDSPSVVGGSMQFGLQIERDDSPMRGGPVSMDDFFAADLIGNIPDARPDELSASDAAVLVPGSALDLAAAALLAGEIPVAGAGSSIPSANAAPSSARAQPGPEPVATITPVKAETPTPVAPAAATTKPEPPAPSPAAAIAPRAHYPLVDYLRSTLIGLPSRIVLEGAPILVIDPVNKCFHAIGDLRALEAYLDKPLARTQWSALLPAQLMTVRKEVPARPFDLLRWYHALRTQPQKLSPHLDPGGIYRLRTPLELTKDHPRGARIAAAMGTPKGLAEIASASATSVVEVYGVVSAFDAIGYLDWQPRAKPKPAVGR